MAKERERDTDRKWNCEGEQARECVERKKQKKKSKARAIDDREKERE